MSRKNTIMSPTSKRDAPWLYQIGGIYFLDRRSYGSVEDWRVRRVEPVTHAQNARRAARVGLAIGGVVTLVVAATKGTAAFAIAGLLAYLAVAGLVTWVHRVWVQATYAEAVVTKPGTPLSREFDKLGQLLVTTYMATGRDPEARSWWTEEPSRYANDKEAEAIFAAHDLARTTLLLKGDAVTAEDVATINGEIETHLAASAGIRVQRI